MRASLREMASQKPSVAEALRGRGIDLAELLCGPAVMPEPVSITTASSTRGLIPAVGVLREARALYPHNAEALAGRRLHDDPALRTIHHRRAQPFRGGAPRRECRPSRCL